MADITEFDDLCERWIGDVFDVKPSDIPEILYHYTDAAGLFGMLNNHKIWATDYRFLNDRSEINHTREIVKKLIEEKSAVNNNDNLTRLYNDILRYQNISPPGHAFVFSLTEEADELSQWRGYAREGRGFTIGFSGSKLSELFSRPSNGLSLCKIQYDHGRQSSNLEKALKDVESRLVQKLKNGAGDSEKIKDDAARSFDEIVENRALSYKHSSFSVEKEWRMGVFIFEDGASDIKIRVSGDKLVRYIESGIGDGETLPILRIGIGPGFAGTEENLAVKQLCQISGYDDAEIYFADTPYRSL